VDDPKDAFPSYADTITTKCAVHRKRLTDARVKFNEHIVDLLATEDQLLDILFNVRNSLNGISSIVLDITSLPKRVFCFLLKRMLKSEWCQDLLVTYTAAESVGYAKDHLSTDALPCDHLPGMAGRTPLGKGALVVSLGFEELNIRSIMEQYHGRKDTRFIMSFPTAPVVERRQWAMLRQLLPPEHSINLGRNLQPISGWDAELVYMTLCRWKCENPEIVLAPFGIKTHTLGMALFAIENNFGMYYTQPKSYNPSYTEGSGAMYSYILKWRGKVAYERSFKYP